MRATVLKLANGAFVLGVIVALGLYAGGHVVSWTTGSTGSSLFATTAASLASHTRYSWVNEVDRQNDWLSAAEVPSRCTYEVNSSSTKLNRLIARLANSLQKASTICLTGVFRRQIRIVDKDDPKLLTLESAPGQHAQVIIGAVRDANAPTVGFDALNPAIAVLGSTGVRVMGLSIRDVLADSPAVTPVGIDVEVASHGYGQPPSSCLRRGCRDISIVDNSVSSIVNRADESMLVRGRCGNAGVDAMGIVVEDYGAGLRDALSRVVVASNRISNTRTGDSENLVINGDVHRFLVANNRVVNGDNIGIDVEGWYSHTSEPMLGLLQGNEVANIDTTTNSAAGTWRGGHCVDTANAAGIYDDGGHELWLRDNLVVDTNQGISLDTENAYRSTAELWVTGNTVIDTVGTSNSVPSYGLSLAPNLGPSEDAGHAFDALYVDAFGYDSVIRNVFVADNRLLNQSLHFDGGGDAQATVVAVGGQFQDVAICHNVVVGSGHRATSLIQVDLHGHDGRTLSVDGNRFHGLARRGSNFVVGDASATSLAAWDRLRGQLSVDPTRQCHILMKDLGAVERR
ncbi:hypothetical protein [Ferrimicrobium sp.]|uniref:hypothetical protein n=1 Tax=Ferrimicrobium sp. TaxID=2926050 RepID=UPI002616A292|nr:hypothetical protein [Ferrimicrobium sp.]